MAKRKSGESRTRLVLLVVGGLLVIGIVFAYFNRQMRVAEKLGGEETREVWPVDLREVVAEPFVERLLATGTLLPMEEATLTSEVAARVRSVRVDLGDAVRRGRVIAVLDPSNYRLAQESAAAQLAAAQTAAKLASDQYERAKKLAAAGHLSAVELDQARTNAESTAAQVQIAQAALNTAERNLRETIIRAPFTGHVSARHVSPGELASPGTPIVTVVKDSVLRIDVALAEDEVGRIQIGMTAQVTVTAAPGRDFTGRITRVGAAADRASGSFPVRVELDNSRGELLAGMRATVAIELSRQEGAIVVTRDHVVANNGGDAVFVAVEGSDGHVASLRPVVLGPRDGQRVLIREGLNEGDWLIVVGQRSVTEGSRLRIVHRNGEPVKAAEPPAETPDEVAAGE
ncbi:MAG: efflux RND transporter periplasmic adaptor subunit [Alphaproteobacteria bacterium]